MGDPLLSQTMLSDSLESPPPAPRRPKLHRAAAAPEGEPTSPLFAGLLDYMDNDENDPVVSLCSFSFLLPSSSSAAAATAAINYSYSGGPF